VERWILGTGNKKKAAELMDLLVPAGVPWCTLADFPKAPAVVEDGSSFAENAEKKANALAVALGGWVLGEDSGLVVTVLEGRPGIYSARFAGLDATDDDNHRKLLDELRGVAEADRTAYYVCSIAVSDPAGVVRARAEARCNGRITNEARGRAGFGYDPLFLLPEYHKTFGELGDRVKRRLSHRARAVARLIPQLVALKHAGTHNA
jgi:XTP/dITP diphosphohydrolase